MTDSPGNEMEKTVSAKPPIGRAISSPAEQTHQNGENAKGDSGALANGYSEENGILRKPPSSPLEYVYVITYENFNNFKLPFSPHRLMYCLSLQV